ncbi:DsbE family thiol:disulfide interchange protein [Reinekea forsetii]|nr:DsbE family thiol:disulfide interchange protein [Reinekea forsetii]
MPKALIIVPLVLVALLFSLFGYALMTGVDPKNVPSALTGKEFPSFKLTDVNNEAEFLNRQDVIGEPMLVNVWATWCTSCKYEHPFLNSLAASGVKIVGINYKDDRELALKWLADYADPYVVDLYDPNGDLGFDLGVTGAPETFFVNSAGEIIHRFQGPINDKLWQDKLKVIYDEMV